MELGINVDSLHKLYQLEEPKFKKKNENDKYNVKLVEFTFFVQNELEISEKLNMTDKINQHGTYRFLTIKKHEYVKVCENNQKIINNNRIILLKYKKLCENTGLFIESFFQYYLNNNSIFRNYHASTSYILWDLLRVYETFFDDFLYLSNKNIFYIDFSSKNLLYNQYSIFYTGFDKCFLRDENIEIDKSIKKFIKILESINCFGNKHFDIYFLKNLIKSKNFYETFKNLDNIIDEYVNNLYFFDFFSDKFKINKKIKWKLQIKSKIEENARFLNTDIEKINWELYLFSILVKVDKTVWETFALNSLFLYIAYHMIKILDINDSTCVLHRYFKFLFANIDINCTSFNNDNNNDNNINIITCRNNYNKFRNSIEYKKDYNDLLIFNSLSHVTNDQKKYLCDLLTKQIIYDVEI